METAASKHFSVLGCSPELHRWMKAEDSPFKDTHVYRWREVMQQSTNWKTQQKHLDKVHGGSAGGRMRGHSWAGAGRGGGGDAAPRELSQAFFA